MKGLSGPFDLDRTVQNKIARGVQIKNGRCLGYFGVDPDPPVTTRPIRVRGEFSGLVAKWVRELCRGARH